MVLFEDHSLVGPELKTTDHLVAWWCEVSVTQATNYCVFCLALQMFAFSIVWIAIAATVVILSIVFS